jgi:hypothetical protein
MYMDTKTKRHRRSWIAAIAISQERARQHSIQSPGSMGFVDILISDF